MRIDVRSREARWEPFLDWLKGHDVEPGLTFAIEIDEETSTAQVFQYDVDLDGKHWLVHRGTGPEIARKEPFKIDLKSLPPRR